MKRIVILFILAFIPLKSVLSCTSFGIHTKDRIIVGKNLDWFCNTAYLVINKRNVTKSSFLSPDDLRWTSKYGSITFNPNAIGVPSGGMNEIGLVIEESWLNTTKYPAEDNRPTVDEIQWIQYQLDNCATVEEVIAAQSKIRIKKYYGKSHYFVYDKQGNAATIEFINGEMVLNLLEKGSIQVLANNSYNRSLDSLKNYKGFGGSNEMPLGSSQSIHRFCETANKIEQYNEALNTDIVSYGFEILEDVSQSVTSWSVVYDISNLQIHYRTSTHPQRKVISFDTFDFGCDEPMKLIDVNIEQQGDISGYFEDYSVAKSRELVNEVVKGWRENNFAMHITDEVAERLIKYPETFSCDN
ncbi:MAG: linear amide C-N hydrolase [Bacteroidota bacterium]